MHPKLRILPTLLTTACIVAVMDGLAAIFLTISYGGRPIRVFQYIASGVIGASAFNGGFASVSLGVVLHFVISFCWTAFFFAVHSIVFGLIQSAIVRAVLYGSVIWIVMNLVMLPLSRVTQGPFNVISVAIGISILIVAAGAPIVYSFDRFYQKGTH